MYINLAIVTNAAYLVSRDKDLLDLITTSTDIVRQFRSRYPFLRIMTAASFITAFESASAAVDDDDELAGPHISLRNRS